MAQTTHIPELVINKLTKSQFQSINSPSDTELYFVVDDIGLTASDITNALGYTPYNATNPAGYTTNTGTVTKITAGAGLNTSDNKAESASKGSITTSGTLYLTTTGVTANSYGLAANATPTDGQSFNVPYFTVNKYGRITDASTKTVTLPTHVDTTNASNITSGTLDFARLPTMYWANVAVSSSSSDTTTPKFNATKIAEASSASSGNGIDFGTTPTAHIGKSTSNLGIYSNQNILIRPGNGSISSNYGLSISYNAITPPTDQTNYPMSLGSSSARFSALYVGTANKYGDTNQPIYWNNGVPVAITGALANDITGNAATATNALNDGNGNNIASTYATKAEEKIYPVNVTLTSTTEGISDKSHTQIAGAVANGKIPFVYITFGNIEMVAPLVRVEPDYSVFAYEDQTVPDHLNYAVLRISGTTATIIWRDKYITAADIPTNISAFTNDTGYLTIETDPTVPAWAKASTKPTYTKSEVGLGNVANVDTTNASNISSGTLDFSRLPTMYWANVAISNTSSTTTSPSFQTPTIKGETKLVSSAAASSAANTVSGFRFFQSNGTTLLAKVGVNDSGGLGFYGTTLYFRPGMDSTGNVNTNYGVSMDTNGLYPGSTQMPLGKSDKHWGNAYIDHVYISDLKKVVSSNTYTYSLPSKSGTIALTSDLYTLPIASDSTLGGIKIGNGLDIDASTGVASVNISDLGLSNALHFIGIATTDMEDGQTSNPTISGKSSYTPEPGDVVLAKDSASGSSNQKVEFVYVKIGNNTGWWELLGQDSSFALSGHVHGNITNDGKLGTASRIVVTDSSKNITTYSINPADIVTSSAAAASGGTTLSLVTTGEKYTWNSKQDALTTQTAYSEKGTATKVAQITTNTLGQVTAITEVDIALPQVMRFI